MKEVTPVGVNHTGIQMSPLNAAAMQSPPPSINPGTQGSIADLAVLRASYVAEADALGSVPVPGTLRGALTTGIAMLTGNSPQILIDKIAERMAFERTGVRLYEAMIMKVEASGENAMSSMTLEGLMTIRNEEAQHFAMLVKALESLGADPTAQTPGADLMGMEAQGIVQLMGDPRVTVAQSLHGLLTIELSDNANWELLIQLANKHGSKQMVKDFTNALHHEEEHLAMVRQWYTEATMGMAESGKMSLGSGTNQRETASM